MDGRMLRRALCAPVLLGLANIAQADLIISEIYYDAPSGDAGKVFVELHGPAGLDLTGLALQGINGADGSVYRSVLLSGVIPADGLFVIADDAGGGTTLVANADLIADVDFQNGPDSIRLWNDGLVVDAVGYGDFSTAIFAGEGQAAPDAGPGSSLSRIGLMDTDNNLADFALTAPTPGTVSAVPLPAAVWLFGSGLLGLVGAACRR